MKRLGHVRFPGPDTPAQNQLRAFVAQIVRATPEEPFAPARKLGSALMRFIQPEQSLPEPGVLRMGVRQFRWL